MISLLSILNLFSVLISFAFQILLVRIFGAALETDVYYLSLAVVQFINMVFTGFLIDLYIPVYNDVKVKSEERAKKFTGATFLLMLISGSIIAILVSIFAPAIVKVFATGFTPEKLDFSAKMVRLLSVTIIFVSLNSLCNATLTANLYMSVTYLANLLIPLFNLIALLLFAKTHGIMSIIYSLIMAYSVNFIIVFTFLRRKIGIEYSNFFSHKDLRNLIKQNIPTRAGNVIYLLKNPLTSNILSHFPTGSITLYTYADRVLSILYNIPITPVVQILYSKASTLISRDRLDELKDILLITIRSNSVFLIVMILSATLLFNPIFGILFAQKVSPEQLKTMFIIFLTLIPFYILFSLESPFVYITLSLKSGWKIFQVALVFIIVYGLLLLAGIKYLDIYAIPFALFLSQFYNTVSYARFVNSRLKIVTREIIKTIVRLTIIIIPLIVMNVLLKDNILYSIYFNLFLIVIWIIICGKDTYIALQYLLIKGEVK